MSAQTECQYHQIATINDPRSHPRPCGDPVDYKVTDDWQSLAERHWWLVCLKHALVVRGGKALGDGYLGRGYLLVPLSGDEFTNWEATPLVKSKEGKT